MLNGHTFGARPNFDALGIFFVSFAILYTIFIAGGLFCLWRARNTVAVRIRRFPLLASAVIVNHVYLVCILIVYPVNGGFKCGFEFWVMNTVLPFGIALFQASNVQLLSLYEEQQSLATGTSLVQRRRRFKFCPLSLPIWWKQQSTVRKTTIGIVIGLIVQLIVTSVLFFGSRMFHKSYGFFGVHQNAFKCRHGTEWIPSVFWQFLWAAVFGPYVLYRIRYIRDTHCWALQTKIAIAAALPGTPMWLAFLYAGTSGTAKVNRYFIPAGWFLPGLFAMQLVTIFVPLYDVHKSNQMTKRASSMYDSGGKSRDQYSMAALETQIEKNIEPLLRWASQKEFTAENIVFLQSVRDFKKRWELAAKKSALNSLQVRERFEEAALIYFTLVNPTTANFNVNIESRIYTELEETFKGVLYEPYADDTSSNTTASSPTTENVVAPWADILRPADNYSREGAVVDDVDRLYKAPVTEIDLSDSGYKIPARFNIDVFDKAFESIKYLVYTNTWVKFIDAGETASIAESDYSANYTMKSVSDKV